MIRKILIGLIVVIIGLGLVIVTRPDEFRVSRSAVIAAPPDVVFAQVNDFHKWEAWSPWAKLDPESAVTFGGAEAGKGATFAWSGNGEVGEGRQEIVESREPELVRIRLEFVRPFEGTSETEIEFEPKDGGTLVTWSMSGRNNFMAKAVSLVMDCDKMVGGQFERGLTNLAAVSESESAKK